MDCQVCGVRSSVGYCGECQKILCETCGVICENCKKISCSDHIHETSGGRLLCTACYEERREKRRQAKAAHAKKGEEDTSLQGLEAEGDLEGEVEDEALVASARRPIQPWQMSLYIAIGGVVVALIMMLVPALRHIPLGGDRFIPTGYVMLIIPLLGIIWALIGLVKEDYYEDRTKCMYGLGTSILAAILTLVVIWIDPAIRTETNEGIQNVRQDMNQQQLKDWREKTLKQFEP